MNRVATKPLNRSARDAANAEVAKSFKMPPQPGDTDYSAFRETWMNAYIENGGDVRPQEPEARVSQASEAQKITRDSKSTPQYCADCEKSAQARAQNTPTSKESQAPGETTVASATKAASHAKSGPEFRAPPNECTCDSTLTGVAVTCSHPGRVAKDGLLQIVAKDAMRGDPVTVRLAATGTCDQGNVPIARFNGFASGETKELRGPSSATLETRGPTPSLIDFGYWRATPKVATIDADACHGLSESIRIERFPQGKSEFTFNFERFLEGVVGGFKNLPFDERMFTKQGTPRKIARKGLGKDKSFKEKLNNTDVEKSTVEDRKIGLKLGSQWLEDGQSNLVFCEVTAWGGWDPLWQEEISVPVYGVPVPGSIKEYIKAGIYLNIIGKITVGGYGKFRRYPAPIDAWEFGSFGGNLSGRLKIELAAELVAGSPKLLQAKAAGGASVSQDGTVYADKRADIYLEIQTNIGTLEVNIMCKAIWGLTEYEESWLIFEGYPLHLKNKILSLG